MLKLTNKFNVLHTLSVSHGILFTLVYNFKLQIRFFPKKKNASKEINYHVRVVNNTGLHFSTFFQIRGKSVSYSDTFFTAEQ